MHLVIFVPHAPLPDTYWIISASVRQHSTPSTQTPGIPFKKQICTSFWHLAFAYSFNDVFCRSLNHLYFIYVNRVRESGVSCRPCACTTNAIYEGYTTHSTTHSMHVQCASTNSHHVIGFRQKWKYLPLFLSLSLSISVGVLQIVRDLVYLLVNT